MCQNVPNEVLLVWFKFQEKIPNRSEVCVQREWQNHTSPSPPFSQEEGIKDTGHSMSIGNLSVGINSVMVSYLIRYDSLLQNATDVTIKCDRYFFTKYDRILLKISQGFY